MEFENQPYALKIYEERQRRIAMLRQPHIAPLVSYLERIKSDHPDKDLPFFDPCDGGVNAKVLFLLEAPGPKAVKSTFISRNNPDPSARIMCEFLDRAGIARKDSIAWNIVPWYVGDGKKIRGVTPEDIRQSFPYFEGLLNLLPNLQVIALVGKKSQSAKSKIRALTRATIVDIHHPSAQNLNSRPHYKVELQQQLSYIASLLW